MDENCNVNVKYQAQWNECYVSVDGVVHCFHCAITEAGIFELYLDDKCIVQEKYMYVKLKGFDFDGRTCN